MRTYDGSGQVVEPDVARFPGAWRGWPYWMVITPYPFGNGNYENASVYVSRDGAEWSVPAGLTNPVVPPVPGAINSDPALLYDARQDRLVVFNRRVAAGYNIIEYTTSADGVHWAPSPPRATFRTRNHGAVSPNVVRREAGGRVVTMMWLVDAGRGCGTDSSAVKLYYGLDPVSFGDSTGSNWSPAVATDLQQPGYVIWHLAVKYVASQGEYWAVYPAYAKGAHTCARDQLFFARSRDGIHWQTFGRPFLGYGFAPWAARSLYKASLSYDPATDSLIVWFSSIDATFAYHLGVVSYRYAAFVAGLLGLSRADGASAPATDGREARRR